MHAHNTGGWTNIHKYAPCLSFICDTSICYEWFVVVELQDWRDEVKCSNKSLPVSCIIAMVCDALHGAELNLAEALHFHSYGLTVYEPIIT